MKFPHELLPNKNNKFISCDLSKHFLIRYTETSVVSEIWDEDLQQINQAFVCSPRSHITDLSTSLLGIFKQNHITIELTSSGKGAYSKYCAPDLFIDPPVYKQHFLINDARGFWVIMIEKIDGQIAEYINPETHVRISVVCKVIHTPMMWNFWHFSIRWQLDTGEMLHELEDKQRKKLERKLAGESRALIAKYAVIKMPNYSILDSECYLK